LQFVCISRRFAVSSNGAPVPAPAPEPVPAPEPEPDQGPHVDGKIFTAQQVELKDAKKAAQKRLAELQEMDPDYQLPSTHDRARIDLTTLRLWRIAK